MGTFELLAYCGTVVTITIDTECGFDGYEHGYVRVLSYDRRGAATTVYHCDYIGQRDKSTCISGALRAAAGDVFANI